MSNRLNLDKLAELQAEVDLTTSSAAQSVTYLLLSSTRTSSVSKVSSLPAFPSWFQHLITKVTYIYRTKLGGWRWFKKIGDVTTLEHVGTGDKYKITSTPDIAKKEKLQ